MLILIGWDWPAYCTPQGPGARGHCITHEGLGLMPLTCKEENPADSSTYMYEVDALKSSGFHIDILDMCKKQIKLRHCLAQFVPATLFYRINCAPGGWLLQVEALVQNATPGNPKRIETPKKSLPGWSLAG